MLNRSKAKIKIKQKFSSSASNHDNKLKKKKEEIFLSSLYMHAKSSVRSMKIIDG